MKQKLRAANFFDDYSSDVAGGGDKIWIPNLSGTQFGTAKSIVTTSGDITCSAVSDTKSSISINTWKGVAYAVSDFQQAQIDKKYSVRKAYAMEMGYNLAKGFDTTLLALVTSLNSTVSASMATALVATNIEKAFGIMASHSVPTDEMAMFISPKAYWGDVMSIQKYYDASQFGKSSVPKGFHDLLYGVPVLITPNVKMFTTVSDNMLVHKSAFAYAFGALPGRDKSGARLSVKDGESLRVKYIADMMYGTLTLNSKRGVAFYSTSK